MGRGKASRVSTGSGSDRVLPERPSHEPTRSLPLPVLTCATNLAVAFSYSGRYNQAVNPLIVTIIIALGTFIISIFGASWLNQQAMNKRIDDLRSYLDARFTAIEQTMNARFDAVDARFNAVDARFAAVEQRISNLEQRVERIERQLDSIFKPSLPRS